MIKGSLLSGSTTKSVSVHDLVRDVMVERAKAAKGGMVELQIKTPNPATTVARFGADISHIMC